MVLVHFPDFQETRCPKLAIVNVLGVQILKSGTTKISTINVCLLIKIRHYIHIRCLGNYIMMKRFNYICLKFYILRNSTEKDLGALKGDILGFWCLLYIYIKTRPDALLAKTMMIS